MFKRLLALALCLLCLSPGGTALAEEPAAKPTVTGEIAAALLDDEEGVLTVRLTAGNDGFSYRAETGDFLKVERRGASGWNLVKGGAQVMANQDTWLFETAGTYTLNYYYTETYSTGMMKMINGVWQYEKVTETIPYKMTITVTGSSTGGGSGGGTASSGAALARGESVPVGGLTAKFTSSTGTLTITGSGEMPKLTGYPWDAYAVLSAMRRVVIGYGITSVAESAFVNAGNLTSVSLPTSLRTIGKSAFSLCGLTSLTVPEGVTTIGDAAFFNNASLTDLSLPSTLNRVGTSAFSGCTALADVTYNGTRVQWAAVSVGSGNDRLSIMRYLKDSGGGSTPLVIPGAAELKAGGTVPVGDLYAHLSGGTLLLSGSGPMPEKDLVFPWDDPDLSAVITHVELTAGITGVSGSAFLYMEKLSSVSIPSSVRTIGASAFFGCGLTSLVLPEGITEIGTTAFMNNAKLERVTLPASLKTVSANAFDGCTGLKTVTYGGTAEQWAAVNVMGGNDALAAVQFAGDGGTPGTELYGKVRTSEIYIVSYPEYNEVRVMLGSPTKKRGAFTALCAVYDETGRMVQFLSSDFTLDGASKYSPQQSLGQIPRDGAKKTVRIALVESGGMIPLQEVKEMNISNL